MKPQTDIVVRELKLEVLREAIATEEIKAIDDLEAAGLLSAQRLVPRGQPSLPHIDKVSL